MQRPAMADSQDAEQWVTPQYVADRTTATTLQMGVGPETAIKQQATSKQT